MDLTVCKGIICCFSFFLKFQPTVLQSPFVTQQAYDEDLIKLRDIIFQQESKYQELIKKLDEVGENLRDQVCVCITVSSLVALIGSTMQLQFPRQIHHSNCKKILINKIKKSSIYNKMS